MKIHNTWRSGDARITYKPDWSPSKPFATYWCGTAGACCATLQAAMAVFRCRTSAPWVPNPTNSIDGGGCESEKDKP